MKILLADITQATFIENIFLEIIFELLKAATYKIMRKFSHTGYIIQFPDSHHSCLPEMREGRNKV